MTSINATPGKVYVIMFILLVIGYSIFLITKTLSRNTVEVEHFVEDKQDYQHRMEVIKIFDLYMSRKPTPDEIDKYSKLGNEQEILLSFLKDFNISASDLNKEKLAEYAAKEVQALRDSSVQQETPQVDRFIVTGDEATKHDDKQEPLEDDVTEAFEQDIVTVPVKAYMEMKNKLEEFTRIIHARNQKVLEQYV